MRWLKNFKYQFLLPLVFSIRGNVLSSKNELERPRLVFILGSGRNGSTLLARLLNQHREIFLPPEQYALPYSLAQRIFRPSEPWRRYCEKQLNLYFKNNQHWQWEDKEKSDLIKAAQELPKSVQNPGNLFRLLLEHYQAKFDERVLFSGDHSPISTEFHPYVLHQFPKAHYIFLVRHPFDVILSYSKLEGNRSQSWKKACKKWNRSIDAYESLKAKGLRLHVLKYEDLVNSNEVCMQEIYQFLGLPPELMRAKSDQENSKDPLGAKDYSYHENLYKPVSSRSVGKWKEKLPLEIRQQAKTLISENAKKFNYALES